MTWDNAAHALTVTEIDALDDYEQFTTDLTRPSWEGGARIFPTKWLATSVEHDRLIAGELFKATRWMRTRARRNWVWT